MPRLVTMAVEGQLDSVVATRVLHHFGLMPGDVHGLNGKGLLDKRLAAYNKAALHSPWLVLRDLDLDAPCAPGLLGMLLPRKSPEMVFRVPVRSIESWILADSAGFSGRFGIAPSRMPRNPDQEAAPKTSLISLLSSSRTRWVREEMCPNPGSRAWVGFRYTPELADFVASTWSPHDAAKRSPSLWKCLRALETLAQ